MGQSDEESIQPGITGRNEKGDSQWVRKKQENVMARAYNAS